MKKLLFIPMMIAGLLFVGCGKDEPDDLIGTITPFEVNKTEMKIPANGGSDSVKVKNYIYWCIRSVIVVANGEETQYDMTEVQCFHYDGNWFTINVPLDHPQWVVVNVDDSMCDQPYELKIKMAFIDHEPTKWLTVKKK